MTATVVVYTCRGTPLPEDLALQVERRYPSLFHYYADVATNVTSHDPSAPQELVTEVRFSEGCPKGREYANSVLDVFFSNGECRRIVQHPAAPNFIEEYGPCPPGVKPPEEAAEAR